ncbi:MAG: hypothetical protein KF862_04315 [Chitinophagaceae bacterium]|nr:hypothetical protein [Chitinophagaceae bacterium]
MDEHPQNFDISFDVKNISDAIKKTGFFFEQRVASIIEEEGFTVTTNSAYLDDEENKSREIDIVAWREAFALLGYNIRGLCYLTCECKSGFNPYVFFTRKKNRLDKIYRPREIHLLHGTYYKQNKEKTTELDGFFYMGLENDFFYSKLEEKAVQFCKITSKEDPRTKNEKNNNNNKNLLEVQTTGVIPSLIYPVVKAYEYNVTVTPKSDDNTKYCKIFFNLVIVRGYLYTIDSENPNAELKRVDFVPFLRDICSESINGLYLTTFVHVDGLSAFLNNHVHTFCKSIFEKYRDNQKKYVIGPVIASE